MTIFCHSSGVTDYNNPSWITMKIFVPSHVEFHLRRRTGSSWLTGYYILLTGNNWNFSVYHRSHTESKRSWKKSGFIRLTARKADFDDILAGFRGIYCYLSLSSFYPVLPEGRIGQDLPRFAWFTTDICLTHFCLSSDGPKSDVYHDDLSFWHRTKILLTPLYF